MAQRKALICGVSGQDGAYLAQLLLAKGYAVHGSSRDHMAASFANLASLGIRDQVQTLSVSVTDFRSVLQALEHVRPDEVYNLSGQSSVGLSFEQPVETMDSVVVGSLNWLEAIRFSGRPVRFYNAGSSECFGDTGSTPANEDTAFRPRSPYAVAKSAAHWAVANYREAYDLWACTGILFNHESPLRPARFVTRKIISSACRIADGSEEKLTLGNMDIRRDWGWAPEYVTAMWQMLQQGTPDDFVIATGLTTSLGDFTRTAFAHLGLDWQDHVSQDKTLYRPLDLSEGHADPAKAERILGWKAKVHMEDVVRMMIEGERDRQETTPDQG